MVVYIGVDPNWSVAWFKLLNGYVDLDETIDDDSGYVNGREFLLEITATYLYWYHRMEVNQDFRHHPSMVYDLIQANQLHEIPVPLLIEWWGDLYRTMHSALACARTLGTLRSFEPVINTNRLSGWLVHIYEDPQTR